MPSRCPTTQMPLGIIYWVPVKEFNLSYHNKETLLFSLGPYYRNLNQIPYYLL